MQEESQKKLERIKELLKTIEKAEEEIDGILSNQVRMEIRGDNGIRVEKIKFPKSKKTKEPVRPGKRRRLDDEGRAQIIELFDNGETKDSIALDIGISYATVCKVLAEEGRGGRGAKAVKKKSFTGIDPDKPPKEMMSVGKTEVDEDAEFTQEQRNEIITQKNRGKDAEWIANYYHLDVDKVQEVIDSLDEDDDVLSL